MVSPPYCFVASDYFFFSFAQSRKARALQSRLAAAAVSRHMQLCADLDGGLHRLVPLDDAVFHRLMSLQTKVRAFRHHFSTNHTVLAHPLEHF